MGVEKNHPFPFDPDLPASPQETCSVFQETGSGEVRKRVGPGFTLGAPASALGGFQRWGRLAAHMAAALAPARRPRPRRPAAAHKSSGQGG